MEARRPTEDSHSGSPTNSLLLARDITRRAAMSAGTAVQSAISLVNYTLKPGLLKRTISREENLVVERGRHFILYISKACSDASRHHRLDDFNVIIVRDEGGSKSVVGGKNLEIF